MTRLAILSAPKPFKDARMAVIQSNALASWRALGDVEILLMGQEIGLAEAAARVGAKLLPEVRKNSSGTPLISSMVEAARRNSESPLLCIINADMIVMPDLLFAADTVRSLRREFVMLGRRWDLAVDRLLVFDEAWQDELRDEVRHDGNLHRAAGSDFFVFPRECYSRIPDFAVGRAGWDNWMIYEARRLGWPVIDCTPSVMAVHQSHDYGHLPGGVTHHSIPESDENIRLAGGHGAIRYTVIDATHLLRGNRLLPPPLTRARLLRQFEIAMRAVFSFLPPAMLESVVRPKRWQRRFEGLVGRRSKRTRPVDATANRAEE